MCRHANLFSLPNPFLLFVRARAQINVGIVCAVELKVIWKGALSGPPHEHKQTATARSTWSGNLDGKELERLEFEWRGWKRGKEGRRFAISGKTNDGNWRYWDASRRNWLRVPERHIWWTSAKHLETSKSKSIKFNSKSMRIDVVSHLALCARM